jgi:hypothetical protein
VFKAHPQVDEFKNLDESVLTAGSDKKPVYLSRWDLYELLRISGRAVADGAYFGVDISSIVDRLVGERLNDGGWNYDRINGSVRSLFASTVLEGLLEYERVTGGTPKFREAHKSGEAYLLERNLFRRLSTGEPAHSRFLCFLHPNRWRYDVLRELDYFRAAAMLTETDPDQRLGVAINHIRSKRLGAGTWPLDWSPVGRVWFEGRASPRGG